jgi:hypothetical protein
MGNYPEMLTTLEMHQNYCRINPKNDLRPDHSISGTRFPDRYPVAETSAIPGIDRHNSFKNNTKSACPQREGTPL